MGRKKLEGNLAKFIANMKKKSRLDMGEESLFFFSCLTRILFGVIRRGATWRVPGGLCSQIEPQTLRHKVEHPLCRCRFRSGLCR